MPWYYAGPEAKPVGPVTLEELRALRARGALAPETYVLEEKGQGMAGLAWKRYQELFPDAASLPPLPQVPSQPQVPSPLQVPPATQAPYVPPPVPPVTPPLVVQAHPLFPSAVPSAYPASVPLAPQPPAFYPAPQPDPYRHLKSTNGWCAWGFGIGLVSFIFSLFLCGIGFFPALLAIPLCVVGLLKLSKNREQAGHWLAIWGLVLSGVSLLVAGIYFYYLAMPLVKAHGLNVTEETTNDSN